MIPTGSTSERSWRTRAGGRARALRWGLCAALLGLAPNNAQATWHPPQRVPGTPTEVVDVWGEGLFSLGWSQGTNKYASLFGPGSPGSPWVTMNVDAAGTYFPAAAPTGEACFVVVTRDGDRKVMDLAGNPSCRGISGASRAVIPPKEDINTVPRFKRGGQGGLAALGVGPSNPDSVSVFMGTAEADTAGAAPVLPLEVGIPNQTLSSFGLPFGVTKLGGRTHVFFALPQLGEGIWVSSGMDAPKRIQVADAATASIDAVDLFAVDGESTPYAVMGAGPFFIQGSRAGGLSVRTPLLPPNDSIFGLSMNVDAGDARGAGFGMAVVRRADGTWSVMSPRPVSNTRLAGTEWVERPEALPAALRNALDLHVACFGARSCVITDSKEGGDNIFVYSNDSVPGISVVAPPPGVTVEPTGVTIDDTVGKGGAVTLDFLATDPDGDPVRFTFADALQSPDGWKVETVSSASGQYARKLTLTAPLCRTKSVGAFQFELSDGLAAHSRASTLALTLRHARLPEVLVQDSAGKEVARDAVLGPLSPSAPPLTLEVKGDVATTGCTILDKRWSPPADGSLGVTQTGDTVTIAPTCAATERDSSVFLKVVDDAGLIFERAITVRQSGWAPLATKTPELKLDAADPSRPSVQVKAGAVECATERALEAQVSVAPETGGPPVLSRTLALTDTWTLPPSGLCGRFWVRARLADNTPSTSLVAEAKVELADNGVALATLPEEQLVATCGERARLVLTPAFAEQACQNPDVTWTYKDGPASTLMSLPGGSDAELLTEATDLESRVGQTVNLSLSARLAGKTAEGTHTVRITTQPFVEVTRRTELPAAAETELVGVSVELFNTTDCGVTRVRHVERLQGMSYVAGSARLDGKSLVDEDDVTWKESTGELTVKQLALAGQTTATLTYVARPHLVGERRLSGTTTLREERISIEATSASPGSGCGCTSSGPGSVLVALVTLAGAARRRRRATARS